VPNAIDYFHKLFSLKIDKNITPWLWSFGEEPLITPKSLDVKSGGNFAIAKIYDAFYGQVDFFVIHFFIYATALSVIFKPFITR